MGRGIALTLTLALALTSGAAAAESLDSELAHARAFKEYRVFHAGRAYGSLPLTGAFHGSDSGRKRPTFAFVYGDCTVGPGEESCAAPYEVQDYAACSRNLDSYSHDVLAHRGRPIRHGTVYEFGGGRVELYTSRTTVVVFAPSDRAARRLISRLTSADGHLGVGDRFPPPARGALAGKLRCGR